MLLIFISVARAGHRGPGPLFHCRLFMRFVQRHEHRLSVSGVGVGWSGVGVNAGILACSLNICSKPQDLYLIQTLNCSAGAEF